MIETWHESVCDWETTSMGATKEYGQSKEISLYHNLDVPKCIKKKEISRRFRWARFVVLETRCLSKIIFTLEWANCLATLYGSQHDSLPRNENSALKHLGSCISRSGFSRLLEPLEVHWFSFVLSKEKWSEQRKAGNSKSRNMWSSSRMYEMKKNLDRLVELRSNLRRWDEASEKIFISGISKAFPYQMKNLTRVVVQKKWL